ncbi:hypothetical protein [Streptomyces sp. NPDC053560]|uniref:hypothetical protein n=1 Tax=Streptomyces sp. NPDC053560 TaxID=3365711 RepID=UPI0037CE9E67
MSQQHEPQQPAAEFLHDADGITAAAAEMDLTDWDDIEVSDTRRVGDTQYTRGVLDGQERIWAEHDFGSGARTTEEVTNSRELSPQHVESVWSALTGPQAPTEVDSQVDHQDTLVRSARAEELGTLYRYEQEVEADAPRDPQELHERVVADSIEYDDDIDL